jgi:hypothetical protein
LIWIVPGKGSYKKMLVKKAYLGSEKAKGELTLINA